MRELDKCVADKATCVIQIELRDDIVRNEELRHGFHTILQNFIAGVALTASA